MDFGTINTIARQTQAPGKVAPPQLLPESGHMLSTSIRMKSCGSKAVEAPSLCFVAASLPADVGVAWLLVWFLTPLQVPFFRPFL